MVNTSKDICAFHSWTHGLVRAAVPAFLSLALFGGAPEGCRAAAPAGNARTTDVSGAGSAVIYCVYPAIFSRTGDLRGVTGQIGRLKKLGVNVIWLMPVTPIGHAVGGHPAFDSPYCVRDYYGIEPAYGTKQDLRDLVSAAHRQGIRVILDEVLNHSSWENPLIAQHPEFYRHSDGNRSDPGSIVRAFTYNDVALFDYTDAGLRDYMPRMLIAWMKDYDLDGFRFDCADNPPGPNRTIPAGFWQELGRRLKAIKADVLLLGESASPDLANDPFSVEYGWDLYTALKEATTGGDAAAVRTTWERQTERLPAGCLNLSLQDDWDFQRDVGAFGSPDGALAAAAFNLTDTGVPLIYNGMEIGNGDGGVNPHGRIDWEKADPRFPKLYQALLALRRDNPALRQGTMTWLSNTAPAQTLTYLRTGGGREFLVEINLSDRTAQGTVSLPDSKKWRDVTPAISDVPHSHTAPPAIELGPREFAIFERLLKGGASIAALDQEGSPSTVALDRESAPGAAALDMRTTSR